MRAPRSDLDLLYSDVRSGYLSKINQILVPSLSSCWRVGFFCKRNYLLQTRERGRLSGSGSCLWSESYSANYVNFPLIPASG
jgi:hypothetical protein